MAISGILVFTDCTPRGTDCGGNGPPQAENFGDSLILLMLRDVFSEGIQVFQSCVSSLISSKIILPELGIPQNFPPAAGFSALISSKITSKSSYIIYSRRDPPTPGGVLDKQVEDQSEPWFHFFLVI